MLVESASVGDHAKSRRIPTQDADLSLQGPRSKGGAGRSQSAMLRNKSHAGGHTVRKRHREEVVVAWTVQPTFSTLGGVPSEVLGRDDAAADSSTMRLNSMTTSGAILSQRRLRV